MFENHVKSIFSQLIDQSSCRILTTHAKTRPTLHDDWSIRFGENRADRVLKHLASMLSRLPMLVISQLALTFHLTFDFKHLFMSAKYGNKSDFSPKIEPIICAVPEIESILI